MPKIVSPNVQQPSLIRICNTCQTETFKVGEDNQVYCVVCDEIVTGATSWLTGEEFQELESD